MTIIISIVSVFAVLLAFMIGYLLYAPNNSQEYAAVDFTVEDIYGNTVKLSDFQGKPIVVNFWATWCGYCVMEMPDFEEMYKKYGNEVQFLMVNITGSNGETLVKAKNFIEENAYTFPVVFDTQDSVAKGYNVSSLPQTYFFDENGNTVNKSVGALSAEKLETFIKNLLN